MQASIFLLTLLISTTASADGLQWVKQTIFGMDCAPCAYGVEQGLKELEGVKSVTVSLNDGYAEIQLEAENTVTLEAIRNAITKNGFTPKDATVSVAGRLAKANDDSTYLLKTRLGEFVLTDVEDGIASQLLQRPDAPLTILGRVPADDASRLFVEKIDKQQERNQP